MDQSLEDKVRQLVDRQEILDCMHRYARGVDRMDAELLQSAFHEDALDCHYSTPVFDDGYLYGFHGRQEQGQTLRCIRQQVAELPCRRVRPGA